MTTPYALELIVIGGSAGGIEALRTILPAFKKSLPVAVLVVVHITPDAPNAWAVVFSGTELEVREAEDKEMAVPGHIYVAPPGYHLLVGKEGRLQLSVDAPVSMARPSIDVLFESAAWAFGKGVLGIVLSGANADGANGLSEIHLGGGQCWVQSPQTAAAQMMPAAALRAVPGARVLTPDEMAKEVAAWAS